MTDWVEVRRGAYHDSVTLMRASRSLTERSDVTAAMVAMGTALNLELLARMGFDVPSDAGPDDLVVAVRVRGDGLDEARAALDGLLRETPRAPVTDAAPAPRTTGAAAARPGSGATVALLSVPGPHVFPEAMDALEAGLNLMVFSDHVPLDQEIALKEAAARRGLIVMGPDCGTAVIGGAGLGFANAVRPGPVGVVAASGTGAQQLMCLLDAAGVGVSHVLGVGGRDLSPEVSGRSALAALAALDADPGTELIVLVSKPPAPQVADLVREAARRLDTPVVFALPTTGEDDLTTAAERTLKAVGRTVPAWPRWTASRRPRPVAGRALRGLFAGGTLRDEAETIALAALGRALDAHGHRFTDFGDDAYTRGRAHPMIDPTLRLAAVRAEAADPGCGVLLVDVVLGHGAEPDPAASLAPAIADAVRDRPDLAVVVSLCGTPADPQDRDRQAAALCGAGADVFASNAQATRHALSMLDGPRREESTG
ncbi:FdrA protein [Actinomadura pelletieri DSM 43383]|uniref:FdrA protein n=1 Tax=Actinomadura pelletieri DSM 43383 TaxID=1120940 RepID=A0A495QNX1_9ACTN|nr:FdrA family protein [Actinomadura pelletieri]RKS74552.1 FdrA protein [Actinomadura pelletieri DSM 43383]